MQEVPELWGPDSPGQGEEETESAVKAAPHYDAWGTGCSAGWPGASWENPKTFSMGLVSPSKKMLKLFQSNLAFPALIWENFDHCPHPFSSGTSCSALSPRLTVTAPACQMETSVLCRQILGSRSCLFTLFNDTQPAQTPDLHSIVQLWLCCPGNPPGTR